MTTADLLSTRELGAYLGISHAQVFRLLRLDPKFPKPIRVSRRVLRFRRREVEAWMTRRQAAA